jgi:hypothetical protein
VKPVNNPSHWIVDPLLTRFNFHVHGLLKLPVCRSCEHAQSPGQIFDHAVKHGCSKPSKDDRAKLAELLDRLNLPIVPNLVFPKPRQAPLKGFRIYTDGYACAFSGCDYACRTASTIDIHYRNQHVARNVPVKKRYRSPVSVQSFFLCTFNKFWEVDPQASHRRAEDSGSDKFNAFLRDLAPKLNEQHAVVGPQCSRDVSPWLEIAKFHEYLDTYMTDARKRGALVAAAASPSNRSRKRRERYSVVHDWVFNYLDRARQIKLPRLLLKHIERYNPK